MIPDRANLTDIELLRASQDTFELLIEALNDFAIFMLDTEGNVATWTSGAQFVTGYATEEIVGKHFSIFYPQKAIESGDPEKELELGNRHRHHAQEEWHVRKDGSNFWVQSILIVIKDSQDNLIGFAKIIRDLTERRKTERLREKSAQMLAQTNNELQRMSYVMSHELQEPLANITRYSNLLCVRYKDRLGDDADEFLEHILTSGKIIARMIDDLWTYARITRPANFGPVNIGTLLHTVLDEVREEIKQHQVKISIPDSASFPTVQANKPQLTYVFKEMIVNSIKHHRNPGPLALRISVTPERNGWSFGFEDNGPGLDKMYAEDAFKIFQRLEGKPDAEGTGMGLAICKKIIELQHKGEIRFQSNESGGTTFFVWLPNTQANMTQITGNFKQIPI